MFNNPADSDMKSILEKSKNIAVVGLSANCEKDSHRVAQYLKEKGYCIIPVNPSEDEILGQRCYKELASIPVRVDIVNVFRRSEYLPAVIEEAISINAGCIWAQLGVMDDSSADKAVNRGVKVVMDRCIKVEHQRLLGEK
ncbi:MAG: CoA-binding protein [Desulfocucumaceae bacterium]